MDNLNFCEEEDFVVVEEEEAAGSALTVKLEGTAELEVSKNNLIIQFQLCFVYRWSPLYELPFQWFPL